ncbi:unnamed protein product [Angiostrongylus costaricensis]|uniref:ANK_REP_REGION domain-containing protein n=1 Tax=Angiostrongylus costaricensis TaxID=334426 RepID=A0A0R3PSA9_ANGCS|nr:unnamed protein product [Angiostrongylus costaricensis]
MGFDEAVTVWFFFFTFQKKFVEEVQLAKKNSPGLFVSAWQEDETGLRDANLNDPKDMFLKEAEDGNVDGLRKMLEQSPDLISSCDEDGYTALHRAAYGDHLETVSFLLESGADSEARTKHGWTPLHSAANWGNYETVGLLISRGVDVNACSVGSVTPLHLAINGQCEDSENVLRTIRYLLQAPGIDAGIRSGSGDTPIELARRTSGAIYKLLKDHINR